MWSQPKKFRFLRPIYMIQLCHKWYAYDKSKLFCVNQTYNLLAIVIYNTKHVVGFWNCKAFDNPNDWQVYIVKNEHSSSIIGEVRTIKLAGDNRKQKVYHINRP